MADLGGTLERAIMDALWSAPGPLRVRELLAVLNRDAARPLAYNTVQTVAERLHGKKLLRRIPDGNAFRYVPVKTREEHAVDLMLDAMTDSCDQGAILARFAENVDPTGARTLLDALRRRAGDDREGRR
ncbi:BlaI/MecI/CopY family transcriptional regulator [Spirillospora sp. CA-294931]|uniref:BlaI/MecI/CopY family transcriptional regulator n=1 Tax=Spirillospora sp. CA-294931 TaxID=3240042 RepID=UPI003D915C01